MPYPGNCHTLAARYDGFVLIDAAIEVVSRSVGSLEGTFPQNATLKEPSRLNRRLPRAYGSSPAISKCLMLSCSSSTSRRDAVLPFVMLLFTLYDRDTR